MTTARKFGVYAHWPYCARICPYCDFNVYKTRAVDAARWSRAFAAELAWWREQSGARPIESLYFGGGTPSLAPLSVVESVIDACAGLWGFSPGAEITLEANPTDAEEKRFASLKAAGVNRLSLGVQAFEDDALRFLKRNHSGAEARRALSAALSTFGNVSFDLIYALPGETSGAFAGRLGEALAFGAPHLSLYTLTIEQGTAFERAARRGTFAPLAEDAAADLFDVAQAATAAAGLPAYEISNHARPGAQSRHNLLYWRHQDYAGTGPGAHGRLRRADARLATEAIREPDAWLAAVERSGHGLSLMEPLCAGAVMSEKLAMGLRLADGIELSSEEFARLDARLIEELVEGGFIARDERRLAATADGRRVLDALLARLLP